MKKYIFSLLGMAMLFSSCDDYLDIEPKGQLIPTSADEFELLLNSPTFFNMPSTPIAVNSDFFSANPSSLDNNVRAAYLWEDFFYSEFEDDLAWGPHYSQVFVANTILDGIKDLEPSEKVSQIRAEALYQRAYAFFSLVNLYAKHYDGSTASTDLGIPLILRPSIENEDYTRSTVEEVYDQAINDIESNLKYLPNNQDDKVRPGKAAAYGLLARIYLYRGEFDKADEAATNALSFHNKFYDLRINTPGFFIDFDIYQEGFINRVAVGPVFNTIMESRAKAEVYTESNDLRLTRHFNFSGWHSPFLKYVGPSTPEMYLIRAEVSARNNDVQAALDDLNEIRKYRFMEEDYQEILSGDVDDIFELVMLERRRELLFKAHRWFDVKRLNAEGKWNVTFERRDADDNVIATLPPNDNNWIFAIPQKIIFQFNPDLKQNPR